tara:strand:+ start:822 stop:1364 length:543 start_codon:yes stop_codon:yes gene_type:complete
MNKNHIIEEKHYLYKLTDGELDYYGLSKYPYLRYRSHKLSSNNCRSKLLDKDKMVMEVLKTLENVSYIECLKQETELITNNECVNKQVSYMSEEDKKNYWSQYYKDNQAEIKFRNKEYYNKNLEHCRQKGLTYYNSNKERLNKRHTCLCGGKYTFRHKCDHIKTKRHKEYLIKDSTYPNI